MALPPDWPTEQDRMRDESAYGVYPLYADEVDLKLEAGADELDERFDEAGITELLQPARPSVA